MMNPGKFLVPRMGANIGPMMISNYLPIRNNMGLFGRITNSIRSFNWSGLLNGANKTLNVVNQTIPLVRQAGPMFHNVKSMLRLAKMFGNETTSNNMNNRRNTKASDINNNLCSNDNENNKIELKKEVIDNNYPNFFV